MAWNEPGDKKSDPWGSSGNRNDQGPPDLDVVFKKILDSLNGIFGKKGPSGSSGGDLKMSPAIVVGLLITLAIGYGLLGFYQVDAQERAVVLRLGKYFETNGPGLKHNWPLVDQVEKINVSRVRTHTSQGVMLTEDQNIVDVTIVVQYDVANPQDFALQIREPEVTLTHATDSAIRHVVGSAEMTAVISEGREALGQEIQERLQAYIDGYRSGIKIIKVNVENSQAPRQVQAAFDDVIKAREDEQRLKNQAEAYSNGIIPEARGKAQRLLEEASAYKERVVAEAKGDADRFLKLLAQYRKAPEVTRQRLYIDSVQDVMSSSSKVMVDVASGSNIMYLPLDRLGQAAGQSLVNRSGSGSSEMTPGEVRSIADQVIEEIRARQSSTDRASGGSR